MMEDESCILSHDTKVCSVQPVAYGRIGRKMDLESGTSGLMMPNGLLNGADAPVSSGYLQP